MQGGHVDEAIDSRRRASGRNRNDKRYLLAPAQALALKLVDEGSNRPHGALLAHEAHGSSGGCGNKVRSCMFDLKLSDVYAPAINLQHTLALPTGLHLGVDEVAQAGYSDSATLSLGALPQKVIARFRVLTLTAFGALIAFGCFLRFWKLTDVGLWYDELWTVVGASDRPFMEMYREWILGDSHPPGFFLFYFAWFKIVPNTEFWARIPSAIVGVITVMYLLCGTHRLLTRDERIMSASFASLSYVYIFYALSVKQYSAMLLFATVATVSYLEIVAAQRVDRRSGITLATACLALAHLNHFAMVYAWILIALLALTFRNNRDAVGRIVRIGIAFGMGYLPIVYFLYVQVKYSIDAWQPYEIRSFLSDLLPSLFFDDPALVKCALGILFGFLLVAVVTRQQARDTLVASRNRHIVLIVLVFAGFMLALGMAEPIFFLRYFLVVLPALFLGLGILAATALPIEKGCLAILPLAFFFYAAVVQFRSIDGMQRQQWDKSVDFVLASKKPGESIFVLGAKMNETEFDYLAEGNVDGVFYVRNLKFYEYYFRRRGAPETAAKLKVVQPTVESVLELAARFHGSGSAIYVLAGHHIQYTGKALATLKQVTRRMEVTPMYSTLVYRLIFLKERVTKPPKHDPRRRSSVDGYGCGAASRSVVGSCRTVLANSTTSAERRTAARP